VIQENDKNKKFVDKVFIQISWFIDTVYVMNEGEFFFLFDPSVSL